MRKLSLAFVLLSVFIAGCSKISDEDSATVQRACHGIVSETHGTVHRDDFKILDKWLKKGKIVAEVGFKEARSRSDSYSVRFCVVDIEEGTVSLPSLMNQQQWSK